MILGFNVISKVWDGLETPASSSSWSSKSGWAPFTLYVSLSTSYPFPFNSLILLVMSSLFGKAVPGSPVNSTVVECLPSVVLMTTFAFWFLTTYL